MGCCFATTNTTEDNTKMIGSNRNKDNAFRKVATGKSQTDFILFRS